MKSPARLAIVASAVVAALLTGCAGASPKETGNDQGPGSLTGTLSIAAAASLEPAVTELAERFTSDHPGVTFENFSFDGSSTLAEQIIHGAPFDVFASADEENMAKVADEGLTDGAAYPFATSSLEIAVAPGNPLGIESLADLANPATGGRAPIVVICAPEVPCGSAAHRLLDKQGTSLEPASEEQNVTAVLRKVAAGEADAGLVYRSDVLRADGDVEGIEIEGSIEAAGTYLIAPLLGSGAAQEASGEAARAFAEYVRSEEARQLLAELGFGPVGSA